MHEGSDLREDAAPIETAYAGARKRRQTRIAVIVLVVLALVGLGGWAFTRNRAGKNSAPKAATATNANIPTVTVAIPARQTVSHEVAASGTIEARRQVPIGVVGEGGRVSAVHVDVGQWVAKGQVLVSVDRSVQQQQVAQARAQIASAQADASLARSEYERAAALVARGFISKATVEQKRAAMDAAGARARVASAGLGELQARNARLDIRAPDSGYILTRAVEVGQVISAGSPPLFVMAKSGEIQFAAQVSETDLAHMNIGMRADVTPVGSERPFAGHIWQIAPTIDPQTRMGIVRIALPFDRALKPGGFASAVIQSGSIEAPLLPQSAVMSDGSGKHYVQIVNAANRIEQRFVETGSPVAGGVPIKSGLTGTEAVVLRAGGFVSIGDRVNPRRERATAASTTVGPVAKAGVSPPATAAVSGK